MTVVHMARRVGPQHASAVRRLAEARDEQRRLGALYAAAVGTVDRPLAQERFSSARAYVASREEWLHWVDEGESLTPWEDGEWAPRTPVRIPAAAEPAAPGPDEDGPLPDLHPSVDSDPDPDLRDAMARDRDEMSAERDRVAAIRDRLALVHEAEIVDHDDGCRRDDGRRSPTGEQIVLRAARDRKRGADERRAAVRQRAAAALDREHAVGDRRLAAADRELAAAERTAAGHDELTGALRRGAGLAAVEREIRRSDRTRDRLVLAFVDVDGLKKVNDSHGHGAGDRLLKRAAALIVAHMRPYDIIVRVGGDEFVCSLDGIDMAGVRERFLLVSADLATSPDAGSVSIGLAELEPGDSIDDLIDRADAALCAAKGSVRAGASRGSPRPVASPLPDANRGERWTRAITRSLDAQPDAIAGARRAVLELRLPRKVRETLALLVSELVTNSIQHAGLGPDDRIDLRITHHDERVRLAVHDRGAGFASPPQESRDPLGGGGLGVLLVEALSERWGVDCDAEGCTVWCEIAADAGRAGAIEREITSGYVHELASEMTRLD